MIRLQLHPGWGILIPGILMLLFGITSCEFSESTTKASSASLIEGIQKDNNVDLPEILESGKLRAILTFSSNSYFIYKGQPMGYEYELVQKLADSLGLELEIVVADDMDSMDELLNSGKGDIIAHGLTVTRARKENLAFTLSHHQTSQVLVQRKPQNWRKLKLHQIEKKLIRNPIDLIGKTISIREKSAYYSRLQHLSDEIGDEIPVEFVPGNWTTDEIIRKVAEGELNYTVADQNIARIHSTYYSILDSETPVSLPQQLAWAVRKSSPLLLERIDQWIGNMRSETDYYVIYNKYFKNSKAFKKREGSEYFSKTGGKISEYDTLIQQYVQPIGWDWRLLASMIYQESQFDPGSHSWAGANGLMQVMSATGKDFGVTNLLDPEQNLKAGTAYLKFLQKHWEAIPDSLQKIKFMMASYNAGQGHVEDARRLAEKYGKDPDIWDENVESYILLKSHPEYYRDPVVRYGYCRGDEPYQYVREIMERYGHYQTFIP